MSDSGSEGAMPSNSTQPPVSHNPQAHDDPHCAQCRQAVDFFSTKGGFSGTLIPKTIMSGETLDCNKHLSLQLGQYCQVHEEDNPCNSQIARTKGAISLGPSGNLQGRFKFIALNSGKKIVRRSWDVIPMPDLMIDRVNALCRDQPQHMTFTDRHRRLSAMLKSQEWMPRRTMMIISQEWAQ
jgi:hypothetical protein